MKLRVIVLIIAGIVAPGIVLAEVSAFFETGGNWVGEGLVAPQTEGELERARCKVETILHEPGSDVQISGHCASAGGKVRFDLRVQRRENGIIAAAVATQNMEEDLQYLGREVNGEIVLESREPVLVQGVPYTSTLTVGNISPEGFELRETLSAPDSGQSKTTIDMAFSIRESE